jgi:Cu-Zn family superoxide dismutase
MRAAFFSLVLVSALASAVAAAPRPSAYVLPGNAVFPEGVVANQASGLFYVSSTTDGTIFRGHVSDAEARPWLAGGQDGRTTAIGVELDRSEHLVIAGGATGKLWAYDAGDRSLVGVFDTLPAGPSFINDVVATRRGDVFATDSLQPVISRIPAAALRTGTGDTVAADRWLDLTGTPIVYTSGFNLNGIAATEDGTYLVVVQSNTGRLFRITIATREVSEIDVGGATVPAGDGLVLRGRTLWVVQNALGRITEIRLDGKLTRGSVVGTTSDPSFAFPTTADIVRGRMLVVNSQFDKRAPGATPSLPFTVSSIHVP